MLSNILIVVGEEMDQLRFTDFSRGYYFYWYFYAGVYPRVTADP